MQVHLMVYFDPFFCNWDRSPETNGRLGGYVLKYSVLAENRVADLQIERGNMYVFCMKYQYASHLDVRNMSSNVQVFILRKTCTCSFMVFLSCIHISSPVDGRT